MMITDRTAYDVQNANKIWRNKVLKQIDITDEELITLQRGRISLDTLNRIEDKISEICSLFANIGYYVNIENTKSWSNGDIFYKSDIQRWIDSEDKMLNAFFYKNSTPFTPSAEYTITALNRIEQILVDIEDMYNDLISRFYECGTFESGEH